MNFATELNPFIKEAHKGYEILTAKQLKIRDQYKAICISFGEDHVRTRPEDILDSLSIFMKNFTFILGEYYRKQERELFAKQRKKVIVS